MGKKKSTVRHVKGNGKEENRSIKKVFKGLILPGECTHKLH